jgi:hypothetical protein
MGGALIGWTTSGGVEGLGLAAGAVTGKIGAGCGFGASLTQLTVPLDAAGCSCGASLTQLTVPLVPLDMVGASGFFRAGCQRKRERSLFEF